MMMNDITICIYSYKGKYLKDTVQNLIDNSSGKNILYFKIIDQYPLERSEIFNLYTNMEYTHVYWDSQKSPCSYKLDLIKTSGPGYILMLGDNIMVSKNWDQFLIDHVLDDDILISGCGIPKPKIDNLFFINQNRQHTDAFELGNYIDRDFIFGRVELFKTIGYPEYIKFFGEEELLSLLYFCNDIDIYCLPSSFYKKNSLATLETLYSPFSIYHNYNRIVELFKTEKNNQTLLIGLPRRTKDFEKYHNLNFSDLEYLPFEDNDVSYSYNSMEFDNIDQRKFMTRTHTIR